MYSFLIKNATILDGSGNKECLGDIAINDNKIIAIAPVINSQAKTVIDAKNLVACPGFIDVQNHSDSYWQLFDNPGLQSIVSQGYTTVLIGQCGGSLAPLLSHEALLAFQKWHSMDGVNVNWQSFAECAEVLSQDKYGCNIASLVGYGTLRRGIVGDDTTGLSAKDNDILLKHLKQALAEGAFGLSAGLAYSHESAITEVELYQAAEILKDYDCLLSVHLRNESENIVENAREAIDLARHTGIKLKIAHLKIRGRVNWDQDDLLLQELETAWHQGVAVSFDLYPYAITWQVLFSYLPKWATLGGRKNLLQHLNDPQQRRKIIDYLKTKHSRLGDLIITSTTAKLNASGKTIAKISRGMDLSYEETLLKLIEHGGSEILVLDHDLDQKLVDKLSIHPLSLIASDGGGFDPRINDKLVHPRCFGSAPKFLSYVLKEKQIELAQAVRKLTGAPAELLGLKDRGFIKQNYFADLVLFDPQKIKDRATLTNPFQYNEGINLVMVNGQVVLTNNRPTGDKAGLFLKKI